MGNQQSSVVDRSEQTLGIVGSRGLKMQKEAEEAHIVGVEEIDLTETDTDSVSDEDENHDEEEDEGALNIFALPFSSYFISLFTHNTNSVNRSY
jgi:hypothetical protein